MIKIYSYTNNINGKVYIGQTEKTLKERAGKNGSLYLGCHLFYNAIKKYGWDNFEAHIITELEMQEQADYTEQDWIARARELLGKENVYNLSDGGESFMRGKKHTKETKKKISEANKGKFPKNLEQLKVCQLGKKSSEAQKQKLRDAVTQESKEYTRQRSIGNKYGIGNKGNLGRTWKKINGIRVYSEKK